MARGPARRGYLAATAMALALLLALPLAAPAAPPYRPRAPRDGGALGAPVAPRDLREFPARAPAPLGTAKVVVLLVDFSDDAGDGGHTIAYFDDLLFTNAAGKLNHYWRQASYQKLLLTGTVDPGGWRRSAQTEAWWGQNGGGIDDANDAITNLAKEAVQLADPGIDFSQFDADADGVVDYLFVVHAGDGEEFTGAPGDIYSHSGTIPGGVVADGVTISNFILVPESGSLGLLAHEFGHALGLPDLYNTTNGNPVVGEWDLMDQGMWNGILPGQTPALPTAWQKILLGWVNPETLYHRNRAGAALGAWSDTPGVIRMTVSDSEYFLIENRQLSGYDLRLPNEGLLLWHCDDRIGSIAGNDLNSGVTRRVELLEADGTESVFDDGGDPFPGTTGKTMVSDTTSPSLRANGGAATGLRIHNIAFAGDTATADFYALDTSVPAIILTAPAPGACTTAVLAITGRVSDATETPAAVTLRLNGSDSALAVVAAGGGFRGPVTLVAGRNTLRLTASDSSGNSSTYDFGLWLCDTLAAAPTGDSAAFAAVLTGTATQAFPQGAAETLTVAVNRDGNTVTVQPDFRAANAGYALLVRAPTTSEYAALLAAANRWQAGSVDTGMSAVLVLTVIDSAGLPTESSAPYDAVTLHFTYRVAGALEDYLRVYWFDPSDSLWKDVLQVAGLALPWPDGSPASLRQDKTADTISVRVAHLSIYGVFPATVAAAANLNSLAIYPNPYRPYDNDPATGAPYDGNAAGRTGIRITGLPANADITVYTVNGEKVAELRGLSGTGLAIWDARNAAGEEVASGVYLLVVNCAGTVVTRPVAIIR